MGIVLAVVVVIIIIAVSANQISQTNSNKYSLNRDDVRIQFACMRIATLAKICGQLNISGYCIIA